MVRHLNNITGVVNRILKNKSRIEIVLSKGSKIIANNEGFDIGDVVCIDATLDGHIVKIRSKLVADVTTKVGTDHLLESSIQEFPEEETIIGGDNGERECIFDIDSVG